jgi:hypothetical protein
MTYSKVSINAVKSWGFCPQKAFFENKDISNTIQTGDKIYRMMLKEVVSAYFRVYKKHGIAALKKPPDEYLEALWEKYCLINNLDDLYPLLQNYRINKHKLQTEFRQRHHKRTFYFDEEILLKWEIEFEKVGLLDQLKAIDSIAHDKGFLGLPLWKPSVYFSPMGLAEAYAKSFETWRLIWDEIDLTLDGKENIQPKIISGSQYEIEVVPDIIQIIGPYEKVLRGRPVKDPTRKIAIRYVLFLFDYEKPLPNELEKQIQFMALNALPNEFEYLKIEKVTQEYIPVEIQVLHINSGESVIFPFNPDKRNQYILELEVLAKAYLSAINSNSYIPRILNGSESCRKCEWNTTCLSKSYFDLSDLSKTQFVDSLKTYDDLIKLLGKKDKNGTYQYESITSKILLFLEEHPGMNVSDLKKMLNTIISRKTNG